MALFPASFIDDLKSHADIVQVVQERVPLRRSGVTWKGLCPFHGEKTPSFHVNGEKGFFHCFGCGAGGDVIKFIELFDKVSFPDAVRALAARAGLPVPEAPDARQDADSQRERDSLLKAHEIAAVWFREQLATPAGSAARRLLAERGVSPSVIDQLGIGYAPASREGLKARLLKEGFVLPSLFKSGLVLQRDEGTAVDRFRNRVMIPICRDNGAIVAFGGRAMEAGSAAEVSQLARNANLCQGSDALRPAREQGRNRASEACRDGRRLFRRRPGAAGRHRQRRRLVGHGADHRARTVC